MNEKQHTSIKKDQSLTQMLIEPSSLTAKFANFCTSSGSQTSHAMPTTFACCRFFLAEPLAVVIKSFRFSSSSLTVICTDSGLPSQDPMQGCCEWYLHRNYRRIIELRKYYFWIPPARSNNHTISRKKKFTSKCFSQSPCTVPDKKNMQW